MELVRRLAGGPRGRWVWAGISGLVLVGLVICSILAARAVADAEAGARARAERVAQREISPSISAALLDGSSKTGSDKELAAAVRTLTSDGPVQAVRVWRRDAKPVFAGGVEQVQVVPVIRLVTAATKGKSVAREVAPSVDAPGDAGSVYQVFVPVDVGERKDAAIVEIETPYAAVVTGAQTPWTLVRTLLGIAFALALGMLIAACWFAAPEPDRAAASPDMAQQVAQQASNDTSPLVGRSSTATSAPATGTPAARTSSPAVPAGRGSVTSAVPEPEDQQLAQEASADRAALETRVAELQAELDRSERARLDLLAISPDAPKPGSATNGHSVPAPQAPDMPEPPEASEEPPRESTSAGLPAPPD